MLTISMSHRFINGFITTKQVKNVQQKKTEGSMLNRDDLYNFIQLSSHLDGFVKHVTLYLDLVCIINLPGVITQFNQLVVYTIFLYTFFSPPSSDLILSITDGIVRLSSSLILTVSMSRAAISILRYNL
jgi:hypothetical protein